MIYSLSAFQQVPICPYSMKFYFSPKNETQPRVIISFSVWMRLKYMTLDSTHFQLSNKYPYVYIQWSLIFHPIISIKPNYLPNHQSNRSKIYCNRFHSVRPFQRAINHANRTYRSLIKSKTLHTQQKQQTSTDTHPQTRPRGHPRTPQRPPTRAGGAQDRGNQI